MWVISHSIKEERCQRKLDVLWRQQVTLSAIPRIQFSLEINRRNVNEAIQSHLFVNRHISP